LVIGYWLLVVGKKMAEFLPGSEILAEKMKMKF